MNNIYKAKSNLRTVIHWLEVSVKIIKKTGDKDEIINRCDQWLTVYEAKLMDAYNQCTMVATGQGSYDSTKRQHKRGLRMGWRLVEAALNLPKDNPTKPHKELLIKLSNYKRPTHNNPSYMFNMQMNPMQMNPMQMNPMQMDPMQMNPIFGFNGPPPNWGPHPPRPRDFKRCSYCEGKHYTGKCNQFRALPHQKRRSIAGRRQWCYKCLGERHVAQNCPINVACKRCSGNHNELLCRPRDGTGEDPKRVQKKMATQQNAAENDNSGNNDAAGDSVEAENDSAGNNDSAMNNDSAGNNDSAINNDATGNDVAMVNNVTDNNVTASNIDASDNDIICIAD